MSTFEDLGLAPNLLKALADLGFESPTAVQKEAIPYVINSDDDLIALAQTGTGKTAAFSLPLIQKLNRNTRNVQVMMLCPTRELCIQITKDIEAFTKYEPGIQVVAVYGGASMEDQMRQLRKGCHIVVGTPGRVKDLINRNKLDISEIEYLVLDEADEMLNMGFKEEIDIILETTPKDKQCLLFSATMPKEIAVIAQTYMRKPHKIEIGSKNVSNKDVKHVYCVARSSDRYLALKRIVDISPNMYGIVFCRTRAETKEVADQLMADGYSADALHGDLSQAQRDYVMGRFRKQSIQLLVATDVAARGIDVDDLSHVLHYKIPDQLEYYVHRSGRTGRAGKKGVSIALISSQELRKIRALEHQIGHTFEQRMIPTGKEVCEKQLFTLVNKIADTQIDPNIESYLPTVYEQLANFTKEEILQKFVSTEFNRFLEYYKNAGDLNLGADKGKTRKERERSSRDGDDRDSRDNRNDRSNSANRNENGVKFARFYINVGNKHKLTAPRMIGMINDTIKVKGVEIGKIEILKGFSMFEIDAAYEEQLMGGFRAGMQMAGVQVVVERTADRADDKTKERASFKFKKDRSEKSSYAGKRDLGGREGKKDFRRGSDAKKDSSRDFKPKSDKAKKKY